MKITMVQVLVSLHPLQFVSVPQNIVTMSSKVASLLRLTRINLFPTGSDCTFWPFAWGFLSAAYQVKLPMNEVVKSTLFYASLGTMIHSAGCVINDMLDRDLDRKVERSKNRPIASGAVTMTEASILLIALTAIVFYMFSTGGDIAFKLGIIGLPACGGAYPLMKRWINWPSLFLGFATSWGVPYAWVATTGSFDWGMILNIGVAICFWGCLYDTIYACQDIKDDEKAGVKSMAILLGESIRPVLSIFGIIIFASLAWAGYLNGQSTLYYVMSVLAPSILCFWHIWSFDYNDPQNIWEVFVASRYGAAMVCGGIIVDHYFQLMSLSV